MTVYVRTSLAPAQLYRAMRETVHSLDPKIPIYSMRTTEEQIDNSLRTERLVASLSGVFGALATLLAVIGPMALWLIPSHEGRVRSVFAWLSGRFAEK